jgi:hypothetical protein
MMKLKNLGPGHFANFHAIVYFVRNPSTKIVGRYNW